MLIANINFQLLFTILYVVLFIEIFFHVGSLTLSSQLEQMVVVRKFFGVSNILKVTHKDLVSCATKLGLSDENAASLNRMQLTAFVANTLVQKGMVRINLHRNTGFDEDSVTVFSQDL